MPWDLFTKIIGDLREIDFAGELALQNYNEPLMNDRIVEEYKTAHAVLPKARLTLYTNGDRLNPRLLGLLCEAGVTRLRVTRYPPRQQPPSAASRAALAAWAARALDRTDIELKTAGNGEMAVVQLGPTRIELLLPDIDGHFLDRGGTIPQLTREGPSRTYPCNYTSTAASIDHSGRLKMCCNVVTGWLLHKEYFIGSLAEQSFLELWGSTRMQTLRSKHARADWSSSVICKKCVHRMPRSSSPSCL